MSGSATSASPAIIGNTRYEEAEMEEQEAIGKNKESAYNKPKISENCHGLLTHLEQSHH